MVDGTAEGVAGGHECAAVHAPGGRRRGRRMRIGGALLDLARARGSLRGSATQSVGSERGMLWRAVGMAQPVRALKAAHHVQRGTAPVAVAFGVWGRSGSSREDGGESRVWCVDVWYVETCMCKLLWFDANRRTGVIRESGVRISRIGAVVQACVRTPLC